jgi:signal transduction histidine kinase/CheY-like chemotaxis protein
VYHDGDGRIWASTPNAVFRRDATGWTKLDAAAGVPPGVRAFAQARDGSIWMATNGSGLARLEDGHATVLTTADGLPSDVIRAVHRDSAGYLWVGTEGRGLARLDPAAWNPGGKSGADRRIVRISSGDGLFDDAIHEILEDDFGRLWMSTNRGIFWVTRAELNAFASGATPRVHSTGYTERDGMRNREANGGSQPAGAKGPDGRLWFPTLEGVVVVDPARVRGDTGVASVVVEQVVTHGSALRPLGDSVALRPDQRDVQIDYTALTFLQPGNVRFRYRLEPYDPDWVDVGSRRSAFYTKLPPGRYTFRVAMSEGGGGWRGREAVVTLHVVPRLWETAGFRWTMLAALGTLLVAGWRVRDARLRSRAALLERVVEERTAALREHEQELARQNAQLEAQALQLRALDVAKTRFFANVSHELRTPLTLTIGPLEDLSAEVGTNPRAARWIELALRNSRRLLRLVNQILDVGKLEAGQMRLAPRALDLVPFVRGIVSAFTPVAERKGLRLTLDVADTVGVVMLDPDAVEKILTNLLSNAVKFTPEGGTVDLDLARDGDAVRLDVRDTGPGIPADQLVHVFERFYQVDESSSRLQPGTGIGLSLVKELVQLQEGTIEVRSGEAGTTFIVRLPAPAVANWQGSARATPHGETATGETAEDDDGSLNDVPRDEASTIDVPTLLVVDDSADLRGYIREHFERQFRVIEAGDGAEGVDLARRLLPDVIISDVMMPGTDGYTLVRALRADRDTDFIPIVLLTAQAEDAQRIAGLERGADDYLTKPFDMRELGARVRNLSARHRRLRERMASPSVVRAEEPRPIADGLAPADHAFVEKVLSAIQRRLDDPDFGVAELAREVAQDRSHLFRRVKQLLGQTPTELIRGLRLEEAERLLVSEQGTVADVAYAVGFNSLSYFCECFRERYGATPAVYRDRARATPAT